MGALTDLLGKELLNSKKEKVDVETVASSNEVIGLYFSAHWCPPCRGFTPQLAEFYKKMKTAGKMFEVIFVSSDRNETEWSEYFGEMPWMALPFNDRDRKEHMSDIFGIRGIPTLVLLDAETGAIFNNNARTNVMQDPSGNNFPWKD